MVHLFKRLKSYDGDYSEFGIFDVENLTYDRAGNISERSGSVAHSAKEFKHGVCIVGGETHTFTDKKEMHEFMLSHTGIRWYAHNAEYDLSCFYENILTIPESRVLVNKGRFIELKILSEKGKKGKRGSKYIKFWDSFNLIPMKLKDIGSIFNLKKLAFDTSGFDYCIRDCEITQKIIEKYETYCRQFHISPRLTTSSTAMVIFRTNFMTRDYWVDDNDLFFKNSYIGGRTEAFKKYLKNGYHYDVNSLYPAAMSEKYFPDPSKIRKGKDNSLSQFEYYLTNYEGVGHLKLLSPLSLIPVLPVHHDHKIIYPVGNIQGWYNFNELRFAIERGYRIIEVLEYYYAPRIETPFKEYIDYWYAEKLKCKDTDPGFYDFCKRMQNGLYGKFGEYHDNGVWGAVDFDPRTKEEKETGIRIFEKYWFDESAQSGFGTWYKIGDTLANQVTDHTIFAWCSYVTSYARMILYKEMEKSGLENIYYVDTDSKFTTVKQESSKLLGEMKLEHADIDAYFSAPKMYEIHQNIQYNDLIDYAIQRSLFKNEYKLKGVSLGKKDIFQKSYLQSRVVKSREALRRGLIPGDWMKVIKEPSGKDTKRVWRADGTSEAINLDIELEKEIIEAEESLQKAYKTIKRPKQVIEPDLIDSTAYYDSSVTENENKELERNRWKDYK